MTPRRFKFDAFTLTPSDQLLDRAGTPIALAPKLFDLLVYLVEHRGRLLTRDELMKAVWPDTVVEENNLTVNISLLRKILGDAPDGKPFIETVPRRGYRFHSGVVEYPAGPESEPERRQDSARIGVPRGDAPRFDALTDIPTPAPPATGTGPPPPALRTRNLPYPILLAILGLGAGIAVYYSANRVNSPAPARTAPADAMQNLAVLPFRNLKHVPVDDFLGFALADAIITKLGYISQLSVRPSSAIARFDTANMELQKIAAELKVDTLLTGTYIHEGNDLRLRAQLVDARTQRLLWSDTLNLNYENLLSIQDRVAQQIVGGLQIPLSPPEAARLAESRPAKAQAYEEYLKGVDFYATNRFDQSIRALEDSARIDPDFPLTWAMLGRAYTTHASLHFGGAPEYGKALSAYQTALRLDPAQIEPRVYMANMFTDTGQVENAVPLLQAALKVNPNHAEANWEMGYAQRFGGLLEESVASAERARRLDPSVKLNNSAINGYLYLGRYEDFIARLPGGDPSAYILFYRGFAEYHLGRAAQAQRDFDRAYELDSSLLQTQVGKTLSYKLKSDPARGMALLRSVERQLIERGVTDSEAIYKVAQAYAQLGDIPAALRMLDKSVSGGFFCYPYLQRDPLLEPIRDRPDFMTVLAKARTRYEAFKAQFSPGQSARDAINERRVVAMPQRGEPLPRRVQLPQGQALPLPGG